MLVHLINLLLAHAGSRIRQGDEDIAASLSHFQA